VVLRIAGLAIFSLILVGCDSGSDRDEIEDKEAFRKELIEKALNDDTRKAGEAFLAENRQKPGVIVRKSGLQYRVISEGEGKQPEYDSVVLVEYEGRRVDGGIFDKTEAGKPIKFPLNQVIKGWREGLGLMKEGAQYELFIPADLAYGARSPSREIPPNSALIFDVRLIEVLEKGAEKQ